jgi:hypothetical protein
MTTITEIRTGLANNLANISGLRVSPTVPDNPNPPIAIVMPESISFDTSFARGVDTYQFRVMLIVGRVDERTAQNRLDGYCNPSGALSVKAAIEKDKTLGGKVFDLRVQEMRNYQATLIGDITYLTADFVVQVIAE